MVGKIKRLLSSNLIFFAVFIIFLGCGDDDGTRGMNTVAITVGGQVAKVDTSAAKSIMKVQRLIRRSGASKAWGLLNAAQNASRIWEFAGGPEVPGVGVSDDLAAVALDDRQVLVTGGFVPETNESGRQAYLFDPASGQFSPAADMLWVQGVFPTLTALADGRVLLAGGLDSDRRASNLTQLYDPASGQFVPGPPMADSRNGHIALPLPDGTVLVVGGLNATGDFLDTAELYDPLSDFFVRLSSTMDGGRNDFAGVVLRP